MITMILTTILLLIIAFCIHVIWWRIKLPKRPTFALLFLFTVFFAIALYFIDLPSIDVMRISLLYGSSALVYTILYSAIEQQSPTLAMVAYIKMQGKEGCQDKDLWRLLPANDEITRRLLMMQQGGWLVEKDQYWKLSTKGRKFANLFDAGALIFGLKRGG